MRPAFKCGILKKARKIQRLSHYLPVRKEDTGGKGMHACSAGWVKQLTLVFGYLFNCSLDSSSVYTCNGKKKHPKYVTSRRVCSVAVTPHGALRNDLRSRAGEGGGVLIYQGGQYTKTDPFMFSLAIDEPFRLQKPSKSKQCK